MRNSLVKINVTTQVALYPKTEDTKEVRCLLKKNENQNKPPFQYYVPFRRRWFILVFVFPRPCRICLGRFCKGRFNKLVSMEGRVSIETN